MVHYQAPIGSYAFLFHDVFAVEHLPGLPGAADFTRDTTEAVLEEAGRLATERFLPLNSAGDRIGCTRSKDGITTPPGFKDAYDAFAQGGWIGLAADPAYGGQGLPYALGTAVNELVTAANMALAMVPGLTMGAIAAIAANGSDEQKQFYLPHMLSGRWTGTMNLTEPQCGTDLGLIRTRATPKGDGTYRINGAKIFISAGDHDLADNIIHLVLARIDGAPAGTSGLSLFIVPKFKIGADGSNGAPNGVTCTAVEHKMGIHGNPTCAMAYENSVGTLLGPEGKGLAGMFVMMNEARLGVGVQGLALSDIATQNAIHYARDRVQGRALSGQPQPGSAADPIRRHADVRRMIYNGLGFHEAARAMIVRAALDSDIAHHASDPELRRKAADRLGLLTPIIKGVFTDRGFQNAVDAQQVFGGHGYIAEWGVEQFVRDARIAMIYEGTNGIQALDFIGRKMPADGGRALKAFMTDVMADIARTSADETLGQFGRALAQALGAAQKAAFVLADNGKANPDDAGAGALDMLHVAGLIALGQMWLLILEAALRTPEAPETQARLLNAQFFFERILPETRTRVARIMMPSAGMMAFHPVLDAA